MEGTYPFTGIDTKIRNASLTCVCSTTLPKTGRLLVKTGRFLPKIQKGSSKERWVCSYQLRLYTNLPEFRLGIPLLCLGLLELRL